eukprot:3162-Pelagomonas_calceolata.AAC.3
MGCTEAKGFGAAQLAGGGNWGACVEGACMGAAGSMLAWGEAGQPCSRNGCWTPGGVVGPHSHSSQSGGAQRQVKGTRELAAAAAYSHEGKGVGGKAERTNEEVSEDTTDETMEGAGE